MVCKVKKVRRKMKELTGIQNIEKLTEKQREELRSFLSKQENLNVSLGTNDELDLIGKIINDDIMINIGSGDITIVNRNTGEVVESFVSVESALKDDRIFIELDKISDAKPVKIDSNRYVTVLDDELNEEYIGVWTDGFKLIAIDHEEEYLVFNEFDSNGNIIIEEIYEMAELNNYVDNNGIEELDLSYEDDRNIYMKVAEGLEEDAEKLIELYLVRSKKSDSIKLMKNTARLMLDAMDVELKYIDINQLLSEVYSYEGYVVGGFVAETGSCVYVLRPGKPTKLVRVECGDVTMDTKLDGNLITHFFNAIEVELDKIS